MLFIFILSQSKQPTSLFFFHIKIMIDFCFRKIKDEISRARRKRRVEKILENRRNAERPETLPAVIPMGWDCRPKKPSDPIDIPRRHWKLQSGYRPREYC